MKGVDFMRSTYIIPKIYKDTKTSPISIQTRTKNSSMKPNRLETKMILTQCLKENYIYSINKQLDYLVNEITRTLIRRFYNERRK